MTEIPAETAIDAARMPRWWSLALAIACAILLMFFAANATGIALFQDPSRVMSAARPIAAIAGIALLVADVFLPIPSIVIMVANGALFGVVGGTLLSLAGCVGAALTAFAVGRAGNGAIRRFVTPREHDRAGTLLRRWGVVAIVVSRPIPIVAETVAILAGGSPMTWPQALLASTAGSIVPSVAYAWAGATKQDFGIQTAIFGCVLAVAGLLYVAGRRLG
jgi:uncharacterized membrane protein YdjX (TVP38/TMEM64 family)